MSDDINPNAPEDFDSEISRLVDHLRSELGQGASRWYYDDESETLYIELECLQGLSDALIEQKAAPVLDTCELDFEEIILLPLSE